MRLYLDRPRLSQMKVGDEFLKQCDTFLKFNPTRTGLFESVLSLGRENISPRKIRSRQSSTMKLGRLIAYIM